MGISTHAEYQDAIERFGLVRAAKAKALLATAKHWGAGPTADAAMEKAREIARQVDAAAAGKLLVTREAAADYEWCCDQQDIKGLLSYAVDHGLTINEID